MAGTVILITHSLLFLRLGIHLLRGTTSNIREPDGHMEAREMLQNVRKVMLLLVHCLPPDDICSLLDDMGIHEVEYRT